MEWKLDRVRTVSDELEVKKFIEVYMQFDNKEYNTIELGKALVSNNFIDSPIREGMSNYESEKLYSKRWGAYIGIFTSNGFGYTEKINGNKKVFRISAIAKQFVKGDINYNDFIISQLCRFQFPKPNGNLYIENDKDNNVKPFIVILKTLIILYSQNKYQAWIDEYEIVEYLERHKYNGDYLELVNRIIKDRKNKTSRVVNFYGRDILMNKCLATGLILKEESKYYLNTSKIDKIQDIITNNENDVFYGNKEDWFEFIGRGI